MDLPDRALQSSGRAAVARSAPAAPNVFDIETRIADLLRRETSRCMTLDRLRRVLATDRRFEGATDESIRRVVERSARFVLLEAADPLGDGGCWPAGLRERYRIALGEVDPVATPRVVLLGELEPDATAHDTLELARQSLAELWAVTRPGAELRDGLTLAMAETEAMLRALRAGR